MGGWLGLLKALAAIVEAVAGLWRDRELREAGRDAQRAQDQQETLHEISTATAARVEAERDLALHPDRLRDDDGFKRPD